PVGLEAAAELVCFASRARAHVADNDTQCRCHTMSRSAVIATARLSSDPQRHWSGRDRLRLTLTDCGRIPCEAMVAMREGRSEDPSGRLDSLVRLSLAPAITRAEVKGWCG